jgi:predicted nucleic acid-binding protein
LGANVFLHYIEGTAAYFTTLQGLLRRASTGNDLEIVTSTLSIAEVAFSAAERQRAALDPLIEQAIQALWDDRSAVNLADVSILVVSEARDLIRRSIASGWTGLKPADAIHLATAKRLRVNEFHTYEARRLDKYGPYLGCDVKEPSTDQLTLPHMDPMDLG